MDGPDGVEHIGPPRVVGRRLIEAERIVQVGEGSVEVAILLANLAPPHQNGSQHGAITQPLRLLHRPIGEA